ncbi:integral membrane protein [Streptomyces sp. Tue 6075]|uniref:hypothetical protein n=1 Tax=Streptomyces sp. Tue 6075 TaxID=1661694 RepID=UPI00094A9704|nr:hypothetical protein [Streptomyces sp. Tue 6075]APS20530.1 integral membrane protein [Streptomyces sp. Tue 6075]
MAGQGSAESTLLRGTAVFAAGVTVVLYLFGLILVGVALSEAGSGADSTPMHQCRDTGDRPQNVQVDARQVQFLPLRVLCRTPDGREFISGVVPSWLNPALAASFAATVVVAAAAFVQADRRSAARQASARS